MKKGMLKRFLAGMLCVSMLAVNDGAVDVVYAAEAEIVPVEKEAGETEDVVKDTETEGEQEEEKLLESEAEEIIQDDIIQEEADSEQDLEDQEAEVLDVENIEDTPEDAETKYCTVTFDANGGTGLSSSLTETWTVEEGTKFTTGWLLDVEMNLYRYGYAFTGWYKEAECRTQWDYEADIVTEDIVLYAGWEEVVIALDTDFLALKPGETAQLTVTTNQPDTVRWSSSDTSVASVDNGMITAAAEGSCVIRVATGVRQACCMVQVNETGTAAVIAEGTIEEDDGHITWKIDNMGKLTVTGTGNVSGSNSWRRNYSDLILSAQIDVTDMTDASYLFYGCKNMVNVDLRNFKTEKITNMAYMFSGCEDLGKLDLSNFDTRNIENMQGMFGRCTNLKNLDVSSFDTGNVTDMSSMFDSCKSLSKLELSNFDTSKVADMRSMFSSCYGLTELDLSNFDTGNVTDMGLMFWECICLTKLDLTNFDTKSLLTMGGMFKGCKSLQELNLSSFDTHNVTSMGSVFSGCSSLSKLDISNFDTSNVRGMDDMFFYCQSLSELDVSNFDTGNVRNMYGMFAGCRNLSELDVSNFNTGNVGVIDDTDDYISSRFSDMDQMFSGCSSLSKLDVSGFDTSNVQDMMGMFRDCKNLSELDLGSFDTRNVLYMDEMFQGCSSLSELNVSSFDTGNVLYMDEMFHGCNQLTSLDVSNFDTGNVRTMYGMFSGCRNLSKLDVSNFNTSNAGVIDDPNYIISSFPGVAYMFSDCNSLNELDLSNFDLSNVKNMDNVFSGCTNLTRIKTPVNLQCTAYLSGENVWYHEEGLTVTEDMNLTQPMRTLPMNLSYSITIERDKMPVVSYPYLTARLSRTFYRQGDILDSSNLKVTCYNGPGNQEEVTGFLVNTDQINMEVPGKKELLVTYNNMTAKVILMVAGKSADKTYMVSFDLQGHGRQEEYAAYTGIPQNGKIAEPTAPSEAGYTFTGWYKEAACETRWDFATDVVTKDTVLYAGWEAGTEPEPGGTKYTVTFNLQGKGTALPEYAGYTGIEKGSTIKEPQAPTAAGYTFTGWYKEAECKTKWNFTTDVVTENMVLYAGWEEEKEPELAKTTYMVTFNLQGKGTVLPEYGEYAKIEKGSKIKKPNDPKAAGYIFTGWYKEASCQNLWDFEKDTVEANIILYAGWVRESDYEGVLPGDTLAAGDRDGFWVAAIKNQNYTGKAIKPEVHVYYQEQRLEEGWDYTLTYKNNIKAAGGSISKAPRVTVKGKGSYKGTFPVTFTIDKIELNESHLVYTATYPKGKAYAPAIIKDDILLKAKTDYLVTYENQDTHVVTKKAPTKEGSYIMYIEGKGSCEGKFGVPYTVTAKDGSTSITKAKASVRAMNYRGDIPKPVLSIKGTSLKEGTDYTVAYANINAKGTATAVFTGKGAYSGVLKKTFKVKAAIIADKDVVVSKSAAYQKSGAKPEISVTVDGVKLIMGVDYTVSYKNNKSVGKTATVTVKGKGNYSGKVNRTFQVMAEEAGREHTETGFSYPVYAVIR